MARRAPAENGGNLRLLDIGTGAGRHMRLAAELGFEPYGIDVSWTGLRHSRERLRASNHAASVAQASMLALPFADCTFGLAVSFGAFYYGTAGEMQQGIAEAWRVLAPKGSLFAVLRTTDDYRYGKGQPVALNTYRLEIFDTNEYNTVQHFLGAEDVNRYFQSFSSVSFEKTETTSSNRTRVDSDWLITAEKG